MGSKHKSEKRKRHRRSSRSPTPPPQPPPPPAPPTSSSSGSHRQQAQQRRSESEEPHQQGSSSGDVSSLSIEETNKLRAKLGLKPLEVSDSGAAGDGSGDEKQKQDFVHAPAKSLTQARQASKLQERTQTSRQRREMRERLGRMRGLADDDEDDEAEMSAAAWAERSRTLEAEKRLAEQRAKELAALDAEFDVSRLVEADKAATAVPGGGAAASSYSDADLAGLRVEHSAKRFKAGETAVLVLKDRGVLDEDGGEQVDAALGETLVNVNMLDDERYEANVRARAQIGSAWYNAGLEELEAAGGSDDELNGSNGDNQKQNVGGASVLAKYDTVIGPDNVPKKRAFVLSGSTIATTANNTTTSSISRAGSATATTGGFGGGGGFGGLGVADAEPRLAADYLTHEEVAAASATAKFRRRKRRAAKSRMLKADDLLPLVDDAPAEEGMEGGQTAGEHNNREDQSEAGQLAASSYASASTKPKRGLTDAEILDQTPAVQDEALEDLQALLERTRRARSRQADVRRQAAAAAAAHPARPEYRVLQAISAGGEHGSNEDQAQDDALSYSRGGQSSSGKKPAAAAASSASSNSMVFDTTAEFCRSLGTSATASAAAARISLEAAAREEEEDEEEEAEKEAEADEDAMDVEEEEEGDANEADYSIYARRSRQKGRRGAWKEVVEAAAPVSAKDRRDVKEKDMDVADSDGESDAESGGGGGGGGFLEEEPELRTGGIAAALELARRKGYLEAGPGSRGAGSVASHFAGLQARNIFREDVRHDDIEAKFGGGGGGRRDRLSLGGGGGGPIQDFKELRNYRPDIKLEYTDEHGRALNEKDAFDFLSHRFHGKGSGKKKTEKRLKKIQEEQLLRSMGSSDTPLGTAEKLHAKLERQGTAYVCLSGKGAAASLHSVSK